MSGPCSPPVVLVSGARAGVSVFLTVFPEHLPILICGDLSVFEVDGEKAWHCVGGELMSPLQRLSIALEGISS